jgi:hypothetical protein
MKKSLVVLATVIFTAATVYAQNAMVVYDGCTITTDFRSYINYPHTPIMADHDANGFLDADGKFGGVLRTWFKVSVTAPTPTGTVNFNAIMNINDIKALGSPEGRTFKVEWHENSAACFGYDSDPTAYDLPFNMRQAIFTGQLMYSSTIPGKVLGLSQ